MVCILLVFLLIPVYGFASEPGYGEPLTITTGTIYRVGTATALQNAVAAVNSAGVPATILISNGVYVLSDWALPITCDNVIIRSLSGDRDEVIVRGPDEGTSASLEHVFWVPADNFTVADITFGWCLYHGIQAHGQEPYNSSGLWVHNCRIVNCNEQFIKGTSADADPEGITDGIIENCLFEFTNQVAYQYYTGGIDIHKGVNWIVRDNQFRYLRATDGMAEHAIHFWKRNTSRAQNIVVERNLIFNCDRGIGFGLGSYTDGLDGGDSVIRNNMVYNNGDGPNTDVGIGLESACDVTLDNNTVYVPYWAPIEFRFSGSSNLMFRNNLLNGSITARDGAAVAVRSNNVESVQARWFRNLTNGDLHVLPGVTNVIDQGVPIADFANDMDQDVRPVGSGWDVGADEYDPYNTDSDGDTILDYWEIDYSLNPTNAADANDNEDGDRDSNLYEWIADTNPRDSNDVFCVSAVTNSGHITISCQGSSNRVYTLQFRSNLLENTWMNVAGQESVNPDGDWAILTDTNDFGCQFYRISVKIDTN